VLSLAGRLGTRGLRVVSVTSAGEDDEERRSVTAAVHEEKMTYPCYLDTDGAWAERADVHGIPVFLVVDRAGKLAYRHAGKLSEGTPAFDRLRDAVERTLTQKL
jgi:hypothetical protein